MKNDLRIMESVKFLVAVLENWVFLYFNSFVIKINNCILHRVLLNIKLIIM